MGDIIESLKVNISNPQLEKTSEGIFKNVRSFWGGTKKVKVEEKDQEKERVKRLQDYLRKKHGLER